MTEKEFDPEGKISMRDFPMGKFERYVRNRIYEEVRQLLTDSDTYIGHNAYLPGHIVLKVIKGSND